LKIFSNLSSSFFEILPTICRTSAPCALENISAHNPILNWSRSKMSSTSSPTSSTTSPPSSSSLCVSSLSSLSSLSSSSFVDGAEFGKNSESEPPESPSPYSLSSSFFFFLCSSETFGFFRSLLSLVDFLP